MNLDRVRGLKLNEEGEYDVLLDGGIRLRLSRRYRKQLESRLDVSIHVARDPVISLSGAVVE